MLTSSDLMASGCFGLLAVGLSAVGLRGPSRRSGLLAMTLFVLVGGAALLLLTDAWMGGLGAVGYLFDLFDIVSWLLRITIGISVIAVGGWLTATWSSNRCIEPVALTLAAAVLCASSLTGLNLITASMVSPPITGKAALYVSDPTVPLRWQSGTDARYATLERQGAAGTTFLSHITPLEGAPSIRWAIVLTGSARLDPSLSDVHLIDTPKHQIVTGASGAEDDAVSGFFGRTQKPWVAASASRIVVSLPRFSTPEPSRLDVKLHAALTEVLKSPPRQPAHVEIEFDGGGLGPMLTLTSASPPSAILGRPHWTATNELRPVTYAIFDQSAEDASRNGLFVVAILLGTAAASLVGAMQTIIQRGRES